MAVAVPATVEAHNGGTNSTTLTIDKPTGVVDGSFLLAVLCSRDDAGTNTHPTLSGWTPIISQGNEASNICLISAFYRVVPEADTESADYDFTQGESRRFGGWIHRITGLDTADPVDVADGTADGTFDGTYDCPSLDPTGTDQWLYCAASIPSTDDFTVPTGMTAAASLAAIANSLTGEGAFLQLASGDATGIKQFTGGNTRSTGISIAFNQEAAGGTPATVTPGAIAVAVAVPAPTAQGAAATAPSAIAVTTTLPAPTPAVPGAASPDAVAAVAALPTPTVGVTAIVTPAATAATTTLPGPSVLAEAVVEPLAIEAVAVLPAPTASGGDGTVTPDPVEVTVTMATPTILAAAIVTPAAIAVATTMPSPTASVAATVTPAVIAIAATMPTPSLVAASNVKPAVILVNVTVPTPAIFAGSLAVLARALGQFHRLRDRLHLAPVPRSIRRGFRLSEGWERVSDPFIYDGADDGLGSHEATMNAVASAWATHAGSDAATLKAAIHTQLDALGYRRPDGTRLV